MFWCILKTFHRYCRIVLHRNCMNLYFYQGFPGSSAIKNPLAIQETWVQPLTREDPLSEGMAAHSSILTWRVPMDRGAWWATVHRVAQSQTWQKRLSSCISNILPPTMYELFFHISTTQYIMKNFDLWHYDR